MTVKKLDISNAPVAEGINGELQAFHIAMKSCGVSVPFTTLMGVGGLAFRVFWHKGSNIDATYGQWSDTSLEAVSGVHPVYLAAKYAGWEYTPHNQNSLDNMYMIARASIDNNIPAITRGPVGPPLPSLIIGYEEEAATRRLLILSKYAGNRVTPLEIPMLDLPLMEFGYWRNPIFIAEPGIPPDEDERLKLIKDSIIKAADSINIPDIDDGRWIGGIKAYEAVIADLEGDIKNVMPGLDPEGEEEDPRVYFLSSFLTELGRARGCAFEFMETFADDFPLGEAAEKYEDIYENYLEIKKILPDPDEDFMTAYESFFNADSRKEIASKLRKMADAELKASDILKKQIEKF